ncbi:Dual specificity phosphatase, catalytic domain [Dillenia turbinata]|uniref:Dual specificity phosphatase, catalytic domain n=1 Tax=Dillenia turbinata TaxID=194707 RepID=A0AAN8VPS5_9MAGN
MSLGISRLIAFKSLSLFWVFAYIRKMGYSLLSIPFLYASLISLLVSIASHPSINLPLLLGKKPDGSFPIWSIVMFSPFLYFVRIFSLLRRLRSREEPYTKVYDGLYIGGWPASLGMLPPGNPAIVDCTCEFPRISELSGNPYLCIPTWDTRAPQPGDIESAVKWACRKRAQSRPIFIHCAYGHGRSVTVTCALLVSLGVVEDWKAAEKFIQERRPRIHLNDLQRQSLEEWSRHRLSSPQTNKRTQVSSIIHENSSGTPHTNERTQKHAICQVGKKQTNLQNKAQDSSIPRTIDHLHKSDFQNI